APARRARHRLAAPLALELRETRIQLRTRFERAALLRGVRAELGVAGPRREVGIRLRVRNPLDAPLHPHLPTERRPVEEERSLRVCLDLTPFPRGGVRVKGEPTLVEALEQHHSHRGRTAGSRGRERHCLRHLDRGCRLGEPVPELLERIGGEIGAPKLGLAFRAQSFARSSAGRTILPPSSSSVGTRSWTTRSTTSASSLSGLRILLPLSSAFPRGPACTARSRSA